jgi:hypothetical protein
MNLMFIAFGAMVAAIRGWECRLPALRLAPMSARVWPISFVRSWRLFAASVLIFAALLVSSQLALAQFTQQGPKLVGIGAVGAAGEGLGVALSADGNTAIVGGPTDNPNSAGNFGVGATWVYKRSNGVWTQQGDKLVGNDAVGQANQGQSVALSGDGSTAIVGGPGDYNPALNGPMGAAWVYTRNGGIWTQQGSKLVGSEALNTPPGQGSSVALSADGNTAIVGGSSDRGQTGAVWVFTRSNGVWTQQGSKLIGTGTVGPQPAAQGSSVALSADGDTAIVGGPGDNLNTGAAWVFTRSSGVWTQQGDKLVGTGAVGNADQGTSVALSADGNTAVVGGPGDSPDRGGNPIGATWVFTRSNGVWTQQGTKLAGTDAVGNYVEQGRSVALSGDGNTAIVGGYGDNGSIGAAWVFTRSNGVWTQHGPKLVAPAGLEISKAKAFPSLCPTTAALSSWAGLLTTRTGGDWGSGRRGSMSSPSRRCKSAPPPTWQH